MYTLKDIRDSLPREKIRQDGLWTRFILRPISIPFTWLALALGLSANTVSYLSVIVSAAGGLLFSMSGFWPPLWGAALFNLFSIFDCIDGNIARVKKTASPWGGWADAVMGFAAYTSVFIASGVYAFNRSNYWPFLVITGVTSSANLLTRVSYQIYKNIVGESAHGSVSFERKLAENAGITGFLMPALLVCHLLGRGIEWIIWFNLAFYLGGCIASIAKTAVKAARQIKNINH